MKCPFCNNADTQVVDSRTPEEGDTIRRRRQCNSCGKRFTTYERAELFLPAIVKKDGSRVEFSREKLCGSLLLALRKRPVSAEAIDNAVSRIEEKLLVSAEREVDTQFLGELVMQQLKQLDTVAYIRFASVYKSFEDLQGFLEEIAQLTASAEGTDEYWMQQALNLAWKGQYSTTPNPRVGCVFVREGVAIATGFHAKAGEAHAEIQAIADARVRGISLQNSTAYISLEPCAHHGLTGPCAQALVATGINCVVLATLDPNPLVSGKGMAILQAAGIQTRLGVLTEQARWVNRGFFSRMERKRPWVRLKVAGSMDGMSALSNGKSQWITSEEARLNGHHLRAQACAVLCGIGTVKADNPQLNVRGIQTDRQPLKVIVDSHFEISPDARLLQTGEVLIIHTEHQPPAWLDNHLNADHIKTFHLAPMAAEPSFEKTTRRLKINLLALLTELAQRGVNELHLEAGCGLNSAFVQAGLVDEIVQYIAPRFLGSGLGLFCLPELNSLPTRLDWALHSFDQHGTDLRIVWVRTNNQE